MVLLQLLPDRCIDSTALLLLLETTQHLGFKAQRLVNVQHGNRRWSIPAHAHPCSCAPIPAAHCSRHASCRLQHLLPDTVADAQQQRQSECKNSLDDPTMTQTGYMLQCMTGVTASEEF